LAAVDAWADEVAAGNGEDQAAPAEVAALVHALLGVQLLDR
jgi:hypothetical protein